ncbi:hypothetical protein M0804_002837 [Polistes exclamans]|nr:hypothetical protein M0804_002837 [Polistes exclamans]
MYLRPRFGSSKLSTWSIAPSSKSPCYWPASSVDDSALARSIVSPDACNAAAATISTTTIITNHFYR